MREWGLVHRLFALIVTLAAVAAATASVASGAPPRQAVVAAGPLAATATSPDARERVELPWLLAGDGEPALAPGGRRLAFVSSRHGNPEVYVVDVVTGTLRRLTVNIGADDRSPAWSPDGRRIVWQSGRPGEHDLYVMDADGRRKRALVRGPGDDTGPSWSPDGRAIAFSSNRGGHRNLWRVGPKGGEPELLATVPGAAWAPDWSPDGREVAFSRSSAGAADVWVLDVRSAATRALTRGRSWDADPDWSPDGRRLVFSRAARGARALWTVSARGGPPTALEGSRHDRHPVWGVMAAAPLPPPGALLPDLDQRAPSGLEVVSSGGRYRLGFTSSTESRGAGPLVIHGVRLRGASAMRARQVIEGPRGALAVVRDVGALHFERHEPHFHWHLQDFVRYELRRVSDLAVVARDRKTGFCLIDRYGRVPGVVPGTGPPRFVGDCGAGRPDARTVVQGSSVGYVDRYPAHFHGQDLELTGLAAGLYVLVQRANPERTMRELRYSNNDASLLLRLEWAAGPGGAPTVHVLRRCEASAVCELPTR